MDVSDHESSIARCVATYFWNRASFTPRAFVGRGPTGQESIDQRRVLVTGMAFSFAFATTAVTNRPARATDESGINDAHQFVRNLT